MIDLSVIESIFAAALERPSPGGRAAYLDAACPDPEIRRHVERLLAAHPVVGSFLNASPTVDFEPIAERVGSTIGPYKLMEQIGEGGMGLVFVAEQLEPVRRKVAVKVIKPGMDSRDVIARFEAERQALALMDHPNIARVLDAGTTDSGRPYFVMELVKGLPIIEYCDRQRLSARERLELFVTVCQAVQHAHAKGVIHRDLKPSNILVAPYDGVPVVKVIDFGVAKAVGQQLTDKTIYTRLQQMIGTPLYMSPEQAEINALDVDIRSDVYSLGVLLYELLTGTTPFDRTRFATAAYDEIRRIIREEEPPKPSTRLSTLGAALTEVSSQRRIEPAKLSSLVRGDLDWIVMKALEKDRGRRYETASAFAADVRHFLAEEPVEARPPSATYRLRKLAKRHRTAVVVASALLSLLMLGLLGTGLGLIQARREAFRARTALTEAQFQRAEATRAGNQAAVDRNKAVAAKEGLRRSLYASDLQLAKAAYDSGNIFRMRALLDGQRPRTGEEDLRGFEWHYLRRLGSTVQMSNLAPDAGRGQISPDGTRYVYARIVEATKRPENNAVLELRLMDVATAREVRRIVPFPGETIGDSQIVWPRFNPDGRRFVYTACIREGSGREHWRMKVFEWETGREVCTIGDFADFTDPKAFDPSGARLAGVTGRLTRTESDVLRIWEVDGGKEVLAIPLPGRRTRHTQSVAFSPDGTHLAALTNPAGPSVSNSEGDVRVWEARTGKELLRFEAQRGSTGLAYSLDGQRLAEIGEAGVSHRLRDARSGKEVLELTSAPNTGFSYDCAFSSDGSRLAVSSADGKVRIWDVTDGKGGGRAPESILEGKPAGSTQVGWSRDGRRVFASGYGGSVTTWQLATHAPHVVVKGPEPCKSVTATIAAASPRFAAAFEGPEGKTVLKVWDESGNILFTATDAPDGQKASRSRSREVELNRDGTRLAYFAADGISVDVTRKEIGRLRVWEIATGREIFRRDEEKGSFHHSTSQTTLSPDGRRLATAWGELDGPESERKHLVSSWDLETGRKRLHLGVPYYAALAFSPDGRRLAVGISAEAGRDETAELRVWDATTGEGVLTRKFAQRWIFSVAYNGEGSSLAVTVGEQVGAGMIKLLDAETGRERLSLAGHRERIGELAFSPDGRRLASLGSFRTQGSEVKLWDLAGGREMLTLPTTQSASGFAFSPDGHRLTSIRDGSGRDAELQVWDATPLPDDPAVPLGRP